MQRATTHPPATKCCHDFAGRRLDDEELLVVAAGGLVIVSMKVKRDCLDVNHQSLMACSQCSGEYAPDFFLAESRDDPLTITRSSRRLFDQINHATRQLKPCLYFPS